METDSNARTWGMLCHLAALSGYFFPAGWILGPLVVWLMKRNELPFADDQGKESLNFQITMLIATFIVAVIFAFSFVPIFMQRQQPTIANFAPLVIAVFLLILLVLYHIIFTIIGAVRASNGEHYRYPLTIRFFG